MSARERLDLTGYIKMNFRQLRVCMDKFILEPGEKLVGGWYNPQTNICILTIHDDDEDCDWNYQSGPVPETIKLLKREV